MDRNDARFFDPDASLSIARRVTPHWMQCGCMTFVTWRMHDSLPQDIVTKIQAEVQQLVEDAKSKSESADDVAADETFFGNTVETRLGWQKFHLYDQYADAGYGSAVLRIPGIRKIVCDSLLKFDGDRYFLSDFVVMPNHLHFLVAFRCAEDLLRQSKAWKRYTGRHINNELRLRGDFWMPGQFDHLVRSERQFEYLRDYIADNPRKANLRPDEYTHFRKPM